MRFTVKIFAIGLFSLVTLIAQEQARGGNTPGGHVNYAFPPGTAPLNDVTFMVTVLSDPGRGNVFWSSQVSFTTHVAYIGMQRHREGPGQFLFSVWGATQWRAGDKDTKCEQFSEKGNGYSCRKSGAFMAGHSYQFKLSPDGDGWYKGTVTDTNSNESFVLGSLAVGKGEKIKPVGMSNWVEYFDWNFKEAQCMDEPYSKVRFELPKANGGTIKASVSNTDDSAVCPVQVKTTRADVSTIHEDGIGISASGSIMEGNGRCLGGKLPEGRANGVPLILSPCIYSDDQNWVFASDGTIRALYKCLT